MTQDTPLVELRVWWIPQIPGEAFRTPVKNFQFEQHIKPDYSNAGGIEYFDADGGWCEVDDEDHYSELLREAQKRQERDEEIKSIKIGDKK